jgi:hypothetical protein
MANEIKEKDREIDRLFEKCKEQFYCYGNETTFLNDLVDAEILDPDDIFSDNLKDSIDNPIYYDLCRKSLDFKFLESTLNITR